MKTLKSLTGSRYNDLTEEVKKMSSEIEKRKATVRRCRRDKEEAERGVEHLLRQRDRAASQEEKTLIREDLSIEKQRLAEADAALVQAQAEVASAEAAAFLPVPEARLNEANALCDEHLEDAREMRQHIFDMGRLAHRMGAREDALYRLIEVSGVGRGITNVGSSIHRVRRSSRLLLALSAALRGTGYSVAPPKLLTPRPDDVDFANSTARVCQAVVTELERRVLELKRTISEGENNATSDVA